MQENGGKEYNASATIDVREAIRLGAVKAATNFEGPIKHTW
jgi:hypothetical protein